MPLREFPILEQVLQERAAILGGDLDGYRNHCRRISCLCLILAPGARDRHRLDKIGIAAAFHDLGIWTAGTFDYLAPSITEAMAYLDRIGRPEWKEEIEAMIENHHKITPSKYPRSWLVEAFRKADWADVTRGLLLAGWPRARYREAVARWPSAGFHRRLVELSLRRLATHPLSPLPMFRF